MKERNRILNKFDLDKTRPVLFSQSFGGSESQVRLLFKYVPDKNFENINLILNNTDPNLIEKNRINILWVHHFINQKEVQNLSDKTYIDKVDYIVFNSMWNFKKHLQYFKIPEKKCVVIKNAIEEIEHIKKSKDQINLIYHTTPWRGLKLLLDVFKEIKKKETLKLHVCSSTIIYGEKFSSEYENKFHDLFEDCKKSENVEFHSYMKNEKIIELLKDMHIFSYPSVWPETSCIAAIEAMAAGCEIVTTNLGALVETCEKFGTFVNFETNSDNLKKKFREKLESSIDNFWSESNQQKLNKQSKEINKLYSWEIRKLEWINFLEKLK